LALSFPYAIVWATRDDKNVQCGHQMQEFALPYVNTQLQSIC